MPTPRRCGPWHAQKPFCTGTGISPSPSRQSWPDLIAKARGRSRDGEVGPARSSEEASEQSGLGRSGARGAKGRGQKRMRGCKARSGRRAGKPCHARRPVYEARRGHRFSRVHESDGQRIAASSTVYRSSSVHTLKLTSVLGPKVWIIGTSAASRPWAIKTRPIRGKLLRASKVYQWPPI